MGCCIVRLNSECFKHIWRVTAYSSLGKNEIRHLEPLKCCCPFCLLSLSKIYEIQRRVFFIACMGYDLDDCRRTQSRCAFYATCLFSIIAIQYMCIKLKF